MSQLVILAAGKGTRLGTNANGGPKCLMLIDEKHPYLWFQLNKLSSFTFSQKTVVGGYQIEKLKAFLNESEFNDVEILNNKDFHLGNIYSLLTAKQSISDGFTLFNADHYYSLENYKKIFSSPLSNITAYCDVDRELGGDDMKVKSNNGTLVSMSKELAGYDCGYVGVTSVPKDKLPVYWKACDAVIQKLGDQANVESVLNELVLAGGQINIADISGSWWTEIDSVEDLAMAKKVIREKDI